MDVDLGPLAQAAPRYIGSADCCSATLTFMVTGGRDCDPIHQAPRGYYPGIRSSVTRKLSIGCLSPLIGRADPGRDADAPRRALGLLGNREAPILTRTVRHQTDV